MALDFDGITKVPFGFMDNHMGLHHSDAWKIGQLFSQEALVSGHISDHNFKHEVRCAGQVVTFMNLRKATHCFLKIR